MTEETTAEETWLSQEAFDRLTEELEHLSGPGRAEIAERIEAARDEGDLRENGGYHAAREEQGKNEARIRQLEHLLRPAERLRLVPLHAQRLGRHRLRETRAGHRADLAPARLRVGIRIAAERAEATPARVGEGGPEFRVRLRHRRSRDLAGHAREFVDAMRQIEDDYRANSRLLTLEEWLRRPRREIVFDNLMRLTSSLM